MGHVFRVMPSHVGDLPAWICYHLGQPHTRPISCRVEYGQNRRQRLLWERSRLRIAHLGKVLYPLLQQTHSSCSRLWKRAQRDQLQLGRGYRQRTRMACQHPHLLGKVGESGRQSIDYQWIIGTGRGDIGSLCSTCLSGGMLMVGIVTKTAS